MNRIWGFLLLSSLFLPLGFAQQAPNYQQPNWQLPANWTEADLIPRLFAHFPLLTKTGSDLHVQHRIESPGGIHLTYLQQYEGIPILAAGLKVHIDHHGKLRSLAPYLQSFSPPSEKVVALLDYEGQKQLLNQAHAVSMEIEAVWLAEGGSLRPVNRAITFSHGAETMVEWLLDAKSGEVLRKEDQGAYAHQSTDTTGQGRVFIPDPCTRGEVAYGALFVDSDDEHLPVFDGLLDTVELKGITYENDSFHLRGPYVSIQDLAPFSMPPAVSPDGNFFYTRDQDGFEDVMVYYHIDTYQRYIQSLGFLNLQNEPFKVDPHGKSDLDQSVFVINGGDPYILFGDGGVDDAEDADVIIHEYGHALSYAAAPDTRTGTERKGLDEGLGDYFAAAYSFDTHPWRWYELFNWDGQNEFWPGREAISSLSYPPMSTSIYTYGEIWVATMMQIRIALGGEVTDRIQLEQMYSLFPGMTLVDAANLILEADSVLYEGVHAETIQGFFCQRNILAGAECLPVGIEEAEVLSWEMGPSPSQGELRIRFPRTSPSENWHMRLFDLQGRLLESAKLGAGDIFEGNFALPTGLYQVQLWRDAEWVGSQKWVIQ